MSVSSGSRVPTSGLTVAAYASPAIALAIPIVPASVLLPAFYAENVGLGLAVVGFVLLAARLLDVISDPIVGWLCDRLSTSRGRYKPMIGVGGILAGLGLMLCFAPPEGAGPGYLFGASLLLFLGWTMVQIPHLAWGADLDSSYHGRSRLMGAREAATLVGLVLAGSLPAALVALGIEEASRMAIIGASACGIGAFGLFFLLRFVTEPARHQRIAASWRGIWSVAPFRRLLLAWFVNGLANGVPAAVFPLFLAFGLEAGDGVLEYLLSIYFGVALAGIPVWLFWSRLVGKHRAWCHAMILAVVAFAFVPFLGPGDIMPFAVICVATGFALGADMALPPAMQADVIDLDRLESGHDRPGLFFAAWSVGTKAAYGIAIGVAFPVLAMIGVTSSSVEGDNAILGLSIVYAVVPLLLKLLATAIVWNHPITAERHAEIARDLTVRTQQETIQA